MGTEQSQVVAVLCTEWFRNLIIFAGVIVAIVSVMTARTLARKKQSADMLFASRGDMMLQDGHKFIREFHDSTNRNIRSLAAEDVFESKESISVRYVLNHFETVSICIQAGIYDEEMIKKCWYSMVVQTYDKTRPLLEAIRERLKKNTYLQEFEWLAKEWKEKPLGENPKKNRRPFL